MYHTSFRNSPNVIWCDLKISICFKVFLWNLFYFILLFFNDNLKNVSVKNQLILNETFLYSLFTFLLPKYSWKSFSNIYKIVSPLSLKQNIDCFWKIFLSIVKTFFWAFYKNISHKFIKFSVFRISIGISNLGLFIESPLRKFSLYWRILMRR